MSKTLKHIIAKLLRDTADKIDGGDCELSESEAIEIMNALTHEVLSKESACSYLNISRSRFDDLVRAGIIPRGKKRRGFKELCWFKDELNTVIRTNRSL